MADELLISVCPETGICTIARSTTDKVDLMPDEVAAIRDAEGNAAEIASVIAECDTTFAAALSGDDMAQIGRSLR